GSSAKLIDNSNADIWVASETTVYLDLTLPLPLADINLAQQVDGVDRAEPLIASGGMWRHPGGEIAPIRVIGFDPQGQLFTPKNLVQGSVSALKQPYTVIVDKTNAGSLNARQIGDQAEVNSLPVQVVGLTQGNRSVASNPYMFTSLESANAYLLSGRTATLSCKTRSGSTDFQCTNIYVPSDRSSTPQPKPLASSDSISYILIRAKPGQNLQALKQKLNAALPSTRAYTRKEMAQKTQNYWQERTGIGYLLSLGATVGIIVGVIIVAQILYSSVSDHIKEFGTLKAMGASDWTIYGVIIEQALWMAVLGYTPGMVLCLGLAAWTLATQGILILITPVTALTVFGITIVMCVGSAVFAIQKVTRVDPAIVFKA
uniref:FtsX-like permease family protein n=1 Tax=Aetokthonos hydrillicola TaxID=1550245 RepID=UPI001ABB397D